MTATERSFSQEEMTHLAQAGMWRMLRSLVGHKVCMTGKMSMTRLQLAALVESAGGTFTNTMSNSVTMLIIADDSTWSSKIQRASDNGTLCVRETEFAAEMLPTPAELHAGEHAKYGAPR